MTLIMAFLGGYISRMCGGGFFQLGRGLEQFAYALPYGGILLLYGYPKAALVAYAFAVLGKRLGHGQYIDRGKVILPESMRDSIDPFVSLFFGPETGQDYWRDKFGLLFTGLAVSVPCGVLFGLFVDPVIGCLIALSGGTKAISYMIAYWFYDNVSKRYRATDLGEILTGAFAWGSLGLLAL